MSISGGIKFFEPSKSLFSDGSILVSSSGDDSSPYAIDRNPLTVWRSLGSDDMTQEELILTLPDAVSFNRIFLIGHNFKAFNVQYDNSGYSHFSGVIGLDGSLSNITETTFSDSVSYYEFTQVVTDKIRIQIDTTQTADDEKYLNQIILTNELGTLLGYPVIDKIENSRNSKISNMLSGRKNVQKSLQTFGFNLSLQGYPASYDDDLDLLFSLVERDDPFLVWLCGGRRGSNFFKYELPGFRLKDVFQMQVINEVEANYASNIYVGPIETEFEFYEVSN